MATGWNQRAGHVDDKPAVSKWWNSHRTDEEFGLTALMTTIRGQDGRPIHAYICRPATAGPHPGILLLHHLDGFDEIFLEFSERLARHGYLTICPNLYERFGHGHPVEIGDKAKAEGISDSSLVADGEAALEWLRSQGDFSGKIGVIGACSGGRHALLMASTVPGIDAAVTLWGGAVVGYENADRPVAPIKLTDQLNVPLLGLFGNEDRFPPAHEVDQHEEELKQHGKDYEFHRYDGAGHAFFYHHAPSYRQQQAMDGWDKVFDFFDRHLR